MTLPQCQHLTKQWHVYLTMDGERACTHARRACVMMRVH